MYLRLKGNPKPSSGKKTSFRTGNKFILVNCLVADLSGLDSNTAVVTVDVQMSLDWLL